MAKAATAVRPWSICARSTRARACVGADNELPDFTPLFLEFLSTLDPAEALPLLADPAHVFTVLAERLRKRNSLYEAVFRAMAAMAQVQPDAALLDGLAQRTRSRARRFRRAGRGL